MESDRPHLRRGEIAAGIGGLALLVFSFLLSWYRAGGQARDAWSAMPVLRWLILVTALCALALAFTQATRRAPAVPVSLSVIVTVLGALTTLVLVVRLLTAGGTPQLGAYLGLLAVIGIACGGFRSLRQEDAWTPGPEHPVQTVPLGESAHR